MVSCESLCRPVFSVISLLFHLLLHLVTVFGFQQGCIQKFTYYFELYLTILANYDTYCVLLRIIFSPSAKLKSESSKKDKNSVC